MPTNSERLAVVEDQVKTIKDDVIEVKADLKEFIRTADRKYAPHWVATVLGFVGTAVGGILIAAFMALLLAKPEATPPRTTQVEEGSKANLGQPGQPGIDGGGQGGRGGTGSVGATGATGARGEQGPPGKTSQGLVSDDIPILGRL